MRILYILPYSPFPPHFGGALRIYNLLQSMLRHHKVTLLLYGSPHDAEQLRSAFASSLDGIHTVDPPPGWAGNQRRLTQLYSLVRRNSSANLGFYSDAMQAEINRLLDGTRFDVIQIENYLLGYFDFDESDAIRILDAQNVEYDNIRRMARATRSRVRKLFYENEYRKVYREETKVCREQDAILVTSQRDKSLLDTEIPETPKFVIPNGVDLSYFHPASEPVEPFSLVFTGAMNYFPNSDGMIHFLREVLPLIRERVPQVKVYVVGNSPPKQLTEYASSDVVITGFVEDVRPFVHRASVYIVPLRMGGGTRLKVLEAMAMKKPIVTTSIGCEGIELTNGNSMIVADRPGDFANAVAELLLDSAKRARLADAGYENVRNKYDWVTIGDRLAEAYESIMAGKPHV